MPGYSYTVGPDGLATIPNIELVSTGSWEASTGPVTFTENDLQSIVASLDDPAVKDPRLIIGHTPPSVGPTMAGQDGFFGEQPTIGKFANLRLADNNQTVVADLVGVPEWLAKILPTAYPSRSVEVYWDVTSATGKKHSAVMPRVAVLGTSLPAVANLEDLQALYSAEGPAGMQLSKVGERVAASRGGEMPQRVAASVQTEDVRRFFYDDFAQDDRYWWWIRAMFVNPSKLIVDDDEGGLYAVPYSVSGDSVSFGDPVEIFTQYVEKDSGKVAAARVDGVRQRIAEGQSGDRLAKYTRAAESRPPNRSKEGDQMPSIDVAALRTRLGLTEEQLPDDATPEQINEAVAAGPGTSPDPAPPANPPEAPAPGTPESGTPSPGEPTEGGADRGGVGPAGPGIEETGGEGTQASGVVVPPETLAQLQRDARAGAEVAARQLEQDRVACVDGHIRRGAIPPAAREGYLAQLRQGGAIEQGVRQFLDGAPAVLPVGEIGIDQGDEVAKATEYIDAHLSAEERRRIAAAYAGEPLTTRIVSEA